MAGGEVSTTWWGMAGAEVPTQFLRGRCREVHLEQFGKMADVFGNMAWYASLSQSDSDIGWGWA
jgi:hypothetical protein